MFEPGVEDFNGCRLVDDGFEITGFFSGLMEFFLSLGGSEKLIYIDERQFGKAGGEFFSEGSHLFAGASFGAVQSKGKPQHKRADAFLFHQLGDAPQRFGFVEMDALDRVGENAADIRRGNTDAGLSEINSEGGVHGRWVLAGQLR